MSKRRKFWFVVTCITTSLLGGWIIMVAEPIKFFGWCLALCAPMFALEWIVKNVHIKKAVSGFICALYLCEQLERNYTAEKHACEWDEHELEILNENWSALHPVDVMINSGYPHWIANYSYKLWRWARA